MQDFTTDSMVAARGDSATASTTLPLGVVLPTKNSRRYLESHLTTLNTWLDLVEEVVVVDSFSSDGTVEFLRGRLEHAHVQYLSHPPGLYASWNHGIARIQSRFTLIATAGDELTRAGVKHLYQTARDLDCDVIISKPAFKDEAGSLRPDVSWPIDDIIATLGIRTPRKLTRLEAVAFAVAHATGALLGSSASNLFRTGVLKRFPFPTDFGVAGDGAWGLMHAGEVSWGIVPERFSSFLIHPSNASDKERKDYSQARRPDEILREAMRAWRRAGLINDEELKRLAWENFLSTLAAYLDAKAAFDQDRRASFPWVLNPRAWSHRQLRARAFKRLHHLKRQALKSTG